MSNQYITNQGGNGQTQMTQNDIVNLMKKREKNNSAMAQLGENAGSSRKYANQPGNIPNSRKDLVGDNSNI